MKKLNKKGFTLVEVLVALAVFSVMALLLSTIFLATAKISVNAKIMNDKTDSQAAQGEASIVPPPVGGTWPSGTVKFTFDHPSAVSPISKTENVKIITLPATATDDDTPNIMYVVK